MDEGGPEADEAGDTDNRQNASAPPLPTAQDAETRFRLGKLTVEGNVDHRQLPRIWRNWAARRTNGSVSRIERWRALGKFVSMIFLTRPGLAARTNTCSPRKSDS